MALTFDQKLKLLNFSCQMYVLFFSVLSLFIFLNLTLPSASEGDSSILVYLELFTCFLYVNIWGNYACVWYKSKLSFVKPARIDKVRADLDLPLHLTYLCEDNAERELSSSLGLSSHHCSKKSVSWIVPYKMKGNENILENSGESGCIFHSSCFCDQKNVIANPSKSNNNNNNNHHDKHNSNILVFDSVFTYNGGCDYERNVKSSDICDGGNIKYHVKLRDSCDTSSGKTVHEPDVKSRDYIDGGISVHENHMKLRDYSDSGNYVHGHVKAGEACDRRSSAWGSESARNAAAGWSRCRDCDIAVPPRSKHCPLCRHCILKRDHHCFFVGCCVGFHNQRYFIMFCLYCGVGGMYSSIAAFLYIEHNFTDSETWGYLGYFLPVVLFIWINGTGSGFRVSMLIFLYWSFMTMLFCFHHFMLQIFLVYRGQTQYEFTKGIHKHKGSMLDNFRSVFGRYWIVGFIVPSPFLGYQGDGTNWNDMVCENKLV